MRRMDTLTEDPIQDDAIHDDTPRDPAAVVAAFHTAVRAGEPWLDALLAAVRDWPAPQEIVGGRRYTYLIEGEAFDWLLLAERLSHDVQELIPADERAALIFHGALPPEYEGEPFKQAIGPAKHRAHRNYFYGVTVEEALQLSFEEDVQKEQRCRAWGNDYRTDESSFQRIYFKPRDELLERFREERGLPRLDTLEFAELKAFTYWLFKYRLQQCDPAKVASDTGRGLARLAALDRIRARSARPAPVESPAEAVEAFAF